jgi:hypothetical protein
MDNFRIPKQSWQLHSVGNVNILRKWVIPNGALTDLLYQNREIGDDDDVEDD